MIFQIYPGYINWHSIHQLWRSVSNDKPWFSKFNWPILVLWHLWLHIGVMPMIFSWLGALKYPSNWSIPPGICGGGRFVALGKKWSSHPPNISENIAYAVIIMIQFIMIDAMTTTSVILIFPAVCENGLCTVELGQIWCGEKQMMYQWMEYDGLFFSPPQFSGHISCHDSMMRT